MTEAYLLVGVGVLALIVALGAAVYGVTAWTNRKLRSDPDFDALQETRPEGHWMGIGIASGMALGFSLGLVLGIAMDNVSVGIALGPAFGASIGTALGAALERRHQVESRPLTDYERRGRAWVVWISLGIGLLVLAAVGAAVLLRL